MRAMRQQRAAEGALVPPLAWFYHYDTRRYYFQQHCQQQISLAILSKHFADIPT